MYNHETTRRFESQIFPGVVAVLKKMTEGRRLELRAAICEPQRHVRDILREQAEIEKQPEESRENLRWLELQDKLDEIRLGTTNPIWIKWGVKQIEGLQVDGKSLGLEDWREWPSALVGEILAEIQAEAELDGQERKNSSSPTTSGEQADLSPKPSTVDPAKSEAGGEAETVLSISQKG